MIDPFTNRATNKSLTAGYLTGALSRYTSLRNLTTGVLLGWPLTTAAAGPAPNASPHPAATSHAAATITTRLRNVTPQSYRPKRAVAQAMV